MVVVGPLRIYGPEFLARVPENVCIHGLHLSTIDLRDAFHMLRLALSSQKYCGITPYYGSPAYHYLRMGMGMSVSPQIWQQFVGLVFQDDLIKRKQNFDVIMDDNLYI